MSWRGVILLVALGAGGVWAGAGGTRPGDALRDVPIFPAPVISMPAAPLAVEAGDFDGDGLIDLAAVVAPLGITNYVVIARNLGQRRFVLTGQFSVGRRPEALAVGNIDGNDVPDLATLSLVSGAVSVLIGRGDGTFEPERRVPFAEPVANSLSGVVPQSLALADLNDDGRDDIVLIDRPHLVYILSEGPNGFGDARRITVGQRPLAVQVADLDADGHRDIVVANRESASVSILFGDGAGAFGPPTDVPVGIAPQALAVTDLDNDGHLDLAVGDFLNRNHDGAWGEVWTLIGDGRRGFGAPVPHRVAKTPVALLSPDLSTDGDVDLVAVCLGSNQVSILRSNGPGDLATSEDIGAGRTTVDADSADFDGDGHVDLAVAAAATQGLVLHFGAPGGAFEQIETLPVTGTPQGVNLADFDGDGRMDLAVPTRRTIGIEGSLEYFSGRGEGAFAPPVRFATGVDPLFGTVADLNRDGLPDLALPNRATGEAAVFFGHARNGLEPGVRIGVGPQPIDLAVADLDGNGCPDLATAHTNPRGVVVALGDCRSFRALPLVPTSGRPIGITAGSFVGARRSDLAVATSEPEFAGSVIVFAADRLGRLSPARVIPWISGFTSIRTLSAGPNALDDLVLPSSFTSHLDVFLDLRRRPGPGHRRVETAVVTGLVLVATADLDGDGFDDMVVPMISVGTVSVFRGDGEGAFRAEQRYLAGTGPHHVAAGDVDGDGRLDLVVADAIAGTMRILRALP